MKQYIRILTCLFWLGLISVFSAQTQTILGNVTDDQYLPIREAKIQEKVAINGITIDLDGNFSLNHSAFRDALESFNDPKLDIYYGDGSPLYSNKYSSNSL